MPRGHRRRYFGAIAIRNRRLVGDRLTAGGLDLRNDLIGRVARAFALHRAAQIVDHDLRATLRERQSVTAAETVTSAGNDRNLAFEITHLTDTPLKIARYFKPTKNGDTRTK